MNNKSYNLFYSRSTKKHNIRYGIFFPERYSYDKFNNRFKIIEIDNMSEMKYIIKEFNLSYFYSLTMKSDDIYNFSNKNIWGNCKTINHCVFSTNQPSGDFYISISEVLEQRVF
jgi:hypothetical protein